MRKSVLALAAVVLLLGCLPQRAHALTVGVIDMVRVSDGYERYIASRKILEARKTELQDVVDQEEKSVLALIDELDAIRATASQDVIMRKRQEVEQRDKELREFVMTTNNQFHDDLDTLQNRTRVEIESVVVDIAKAKSLDIVIEKNLTLFSSDALDVTDELVAELNKRFKPLPAPAASATPARPGASSITAPPTAGAPIPTTPSRGGIFRDNR